jgi:hypothetical protein
LTYVTIPPGETTWDAANDLCCPGFRVEYVLTGSYTIVATSPVQVVRAGAIDSLEELAANTETVLMPGDAVLYPNQSTITARNSGTAPVELLFWLLFDDRTGSYMSDPFPAGWVAHAADERSGLHVPDGPARLEIRRATVASGATLAAPADAIQQLVIPLAEGSYLTRTAQNAVRNTGATALTVYAVSLAPAAADLASPIAATPTT